MSELCPMLGESCKHGSCAWFCKEDGRCAIAVLPSVLDWLTRFAVTKPYEKGDEEDGSKENVQHENR